MPQWSELIMESLIILVLTAVLALLATLPL